MGNIIGDAFNAAGNFAGDLAGDALGFAGDLASKGGSLIGNVNPFLGSSLSLGGGFAQGLVGEITRQQEQNCRDAGSARGEHGEKRDGHKCKGGSGGGGSIFERIAVAMGDAMNNKLKELLKASDSVGSGAAGDQVLKVSAQVTARGQELNAISQAFNSAINSVGQAAQNAARKT